MQLNWTKTALSFQMLKQSESMCKASLQEDEEVEEEDIDRETGIIRVQIAYAIQMQVQSWHSFI